MGVRGTNVYDGWNWRGWFAKSDSGVHWSEDRQIPMIDFITVSKDPVRVAALERSLHATFGPPGVWRLTPIDGAAHDLFTGYNAGAAQTSHDLLAFLHDDVLLLSNA